MLLAIDLNPIEKLPLRNSSLCFIVASLLFSSCSTHKVVAKRLPLEILNCKTLKEKIGVRSQLVRRVEGKATMRDKSGRWPVLISMRSDYQFWIEIRSPLGGAFAVLRADKDWVEFFIPRRKEIYRIPATEFWRNTPRQNRFLELLPVKIKPEQMFDLIMGRFLAEEVTACQWSESKKLYALKMKKQNREIVSYVDPISFHPHQFGLEGDVFMVKALEGAIYRSDTLEFASAFDFYRNNQKEMSFEWIELSWRTDLGEAPPLFPESLSVKRINY